MKKENSMCGHHYKIEFHRAIASCVLVLVLMPDNVFFERERLRRKTRKQRTISLFRTNIAANIYLGWMIEAWAASFELATNAASLSRGRVLALTFAAEPLEYPSREKSRNFTAVELCFYLHNASMLSRFNRARTHPSQIF
jgi:hypothetical protein